jgi:hypothetical protein
MDKAGGEKHSPGTKEKPDSLGIAVAGTQIWGCAGGEAARTPPNLEFFTANPEDPKA